MGSSDSDDDFQKSELDPRQSRRVYLLTYSKANVEKFPSCQSFSYAATKAFAVTGVEVSYCACYQEYHKNNDIHYNMAVSMTNLNQSTTSTCISLINPLVTLLLIGTFANQTRKYCIVKTTLTLEIFVPPEPKPAWKPTRQKTVPLGSR